MVKKTRFNLYLTSRQMEALRKLSAKTGLSIADLIRRAVEQYLKEMK